MIQRSVLSDLSKKHYNENDKVQRADWRTQDHLKMTRMSGSKIERNKKRVKTFTQYYIMGVTTNCFICCDLCVGAQ